MSSGRQSPIVGFSAERRRVGEVEIAYSIGGQGPPLLLLHGYPQTHAMWHAVAPLLARDHTVVAADLRGYGDSSKPPGGRGSRAYAKREMARDQVALMNALGFERFAVAGHDRGGRVAHRMALDHPRVVIRLAVLDIVPTRTVFATADQDLATAYFHWFFLIQPDGLPEAMIGADPRWWLDELVARWSGPGFTPDPAARAEYHRCFATTDGVRASCDDYRAAAGIDLEHDAADPGPLGAPVLVMWGARGAMDRIYDLPATWRALAREVTPVRLDCGHFLAEEAPVATASALADFFRDP